MSGVGEGARTRPVSGARLRVDYTDRHAFARVRHVRGQERDGSAWIHHRRWAGRTPGQTARENTPRRAHGLLLARGSSRLVASARPGAEVQVTLIPVLIVGGGPVGFALAIELGIAGIRCLVVERREGLIRQPRMTGLSIRSMEFN